MMTTEELQQFLSKANNAIIGANRADAGPQLTPVWYYWDGAAFYFSTTKDRAKYPNLKRDPNISLIIDDVASRKYVVAYGRAEFIEQNYGDLLRPLLAKYVPADNVEQALAGILADPSRVLVVVHPTKVITN
ncbi:MAG TPA: PPOX class F420-dependent oxidoreductase [Ktedonobacteraceae bacterium]|nr:PPOX class F420-dependent oxidoreductase [Ktedonobacteraceae bacterium]